MQIGKGSNPAGGKHWTQGKNNLSSGDRLPSVKRGVSFVVPVFNKAAWLPAVLQSIAAQTGNFDREYIFVDDGSTDGSEKILREVTRGWSNCRLIFQENQGAARASNRALELVSQPYVKFVDADDLLVANATDLLLDALHGRTDACLAYGQALPYDCLPGELPGQEATDAAIPVLVEDALRRVMTTGWFNPTQMLVRTDCIRAVGGSDIRIRHAQDYTLLLRLSHRWPFVEVGTKVALIQSTDPQRLTACRAEQQQEATMALAMFLSESPNTPDRLVRFACRRAAKRALLYARRRLSGRVARERYWNVLKAYIPGWVGDPVEFIKGCAMVFEPEVLFLRRKAATKTGAGGTSPPRQTETV